MLTQVKAEIEVNGTVRLLEPLKIKKRSRAIVTLLDDDVDGIALTDDEATAAEERFAKHIGSISSGNPTSAENGQIDTDLTHEYEDSHE